MAELGMGPLGQRLDLRFVGQIRRHGAGVYTFSLQLGGTLLDARTAGGDQHPHTDAAQAPGNGQADAAVAAGATDQRHLPLPN